MAAMSEPSPSRVELELGARKVTLETGRIARQANAAVLVREGDNAVLVSVVGAKSPRPGADFFPLTVEYREKLAAAGRIPGSFNRREGRISDAEILACRVIDRSLRPLFPKAYRAEVQIQATVFSAHPAADLVSLALIGAGAALHLSDVPFDGPVLGCRSVIHKERTTLLPVQAEVDESSADLIVALGPQGLVMVEGEAKHVPEAQVLDHLFETIDRLEGERGKLDAWRGEVGKPKMTFESEELSDAWKARCRELCAEGIASALAEPQKLERRALLDEVCAQYHARLAELSSEAGSDGDADIEAARELAASDDLFWGLQKQLVRERVVRDGLRLDGRKPDEIRPIWGETSILPRTHGSALFTRGETQAIVSCTLGSERDAQRIESVHGSSSERFLLHYNFPPYSVGETRPLRGPGRREIGHGNLAHRSLAQVLPSFEAFPYVVRIESDITESNGSSSMATVCGGCLALMDAGVPLAQPVAGVAMGLIAEGDDIAILSDILGDEDHLGDMDFKVTGSADGITALQMDNKIGGLTREVLERAVDQARCGLDHVLAKVQELCKAPGKLSEHAPRVTSMRIVPQLIGALIGPRGSTIQELQNTTGTKISVDDSGLVTILAEDGASAKRALAAVRQIVGEVKVGETYKGKVTNVRPFGAFVKIYESAEGLCETKRLGGRSPDVGQELEVRVLGVDSRGRISLEPV